MSEFQPIVSTNLESAAYDAAEQTITVRFKSGTAYKYSNATAKIWTDFQKQFDGKQGRSAGKFFQSTIRVMQCEKIDDWK